MERSHVLDRRHDRMLHVISARTGRNLSDVVQQALSEVLRRTGVDHADLEALDKGPIAPGPPPAQPVRRTVTILSQQDAVLRTYRLLFQVRASDVVRQAIDHTFPPSLTERVSYVARVRLTRRSGTAPLGGCTRSRSGPGW